ncbi:auxin-responsive protein SAUR64-like [Macadamia integrifolia]|uniref:auxin-responsive protein SAUR64-like n=1 Tax=Macadamia integrifolia TaxID=60698 RepID=UPI001C4EA033|nr:auxin-responsive protein SAUR64-like [Macadamia integrifolia]
MKPKGLVEMVKRWQRLAVLASKRVFFSRSMVRLVAGKGHFAVYAEDGRRFEVPLLFLGEPIFTELLKMGEKEFGLASDRPIMLPCDGDFLESVLSKLRYWHSGQPLKRLKKKAQICWVL